MKLVIADGFFARLVGWMGRERLPQDQALWLVPCRAVHTLGMRCALDLVFLDRQGRIRWRQYGTDMSLTAIRAAIEEVLAHPDP